MGRTEEQNRARKEAARLFNLRNAGTSSHKTGQREAMRDVGKVVEKTNGGPSRHAWKKREILGRERLAQTTIDLGIREETQEVVQNPPVIINHDFPVIPDTCIYVSAYAAGNAFCRRIFELAEQKLVRLCKTEDIENEVKDTFSINPKIKLTFEHDQDSQDWLLGLLVDAANVTNVGPIRRHYRCEHHKDNKLFRAFEKVKLASGGKGVVISHDERHVIPMRIIYPELEGRVFTPKEYLAKFFPV